MKIFPLVLLAATTLCIFSDGKGNTAVVIAATPTPADNDNSVSHDNDSNGNHGKKHRRHPKVKGIKIGKYSWRDKYDHLRPVDAFDPKNDDRLVQAQTYLLELRKNTLKIKLALKDADCKRKIKVLRNKFEKVDERGQKINVIVGSPNRR